MDTMYHCSVRIVTQTEENVSEVCASGRFQQVSQGFQVFYLQDGDEVTVRVGRDSFSMKRSGGTELEAEFSPSARSRVALCWNGFRGEIPVQTREYTLTESENGFTAELYYALGEGHQTQIFKIKFIIIGILEEK